MRVGFRLKFADRPVIPRTTILTQAPLSMAVHLGSYLRQSDAEHPRNVAFLMINEGRRNLRRYNANHADLFIQAEHELSPGTILYADIAAFEAFTVWSPAALKNS